ncbi:MAG: DUF4412 domain-containing protein [Rudaea sp.]|nr:DUF4412 domain-containing protein [Rudaea sp.]
MQHRIALVLACACLAPAAAWADFRADFDASQGSNASALTRIELAGDHMRTDAGNVSLLFDTGSGRLLMLEHDKHQYLDMAKIAETAGAAMAQANAAMANLPPEQRAMIQKRMGGAMGGMGAKVDVHVVPTGASDRVAGYACQVYRTEINGEHREDSCLASVADAGISATDQTALRKAFAQLNAMTEKMSAGMFKSPLNQMPTDRFPVRITQYGDDGKVTQVVQIKSIAASSISATDFAIPAGYTEHEISMGRHH